MLKDKLVKITIIVIVIIIAIIAIIMEIVIIDEPFFLTNLRREIKTV